MHSSELTNKQAKEQGFTLIELSIVLVIIGLIVGGILVGQDLIKGAQIRATISQIEKYDSAVNTFRNKYNGLPGDLANALNFFAAGDVPTVGHCTKYNPGNGAFDDCATGAGGVTLAGEPAAFWHHMYLANMIGDAMTDTALLGSTAAIAAPASTGAAFPAAKIGSGNYVFAYTGNSLLVEPGMAGANVYRLAGGTVAATGVPTFTNSLTPLEIFAIDSKKDDGVPNTGVVQAIDATGSFNAAADTFTSGGANCVNGTAYNTLAATGNTRLCQAIMRTSF